MQLSELIYQAGIVGCGGAGFPTHIKYGGNKGLIKTIIINGAECEPLLQTDCHIMRHHAMALVKAINLLKQETAAEDCVIALKHTYTREITALKAAIEETQVQIGIHLLDSFFPAGDEQSIVFEVTGQVVPPAGIPLETGCVVSNIATIYCISEAMDGIPFTRKYLTITGAVRNPIIARVPVGTPVKDCLKLAGGTFLEDYVVVDGGPMMGKLMQREEAELSYVTKTMSGLLVLPPEHIIAGHSQTTVSHMLNRAKSACIQCSFCTQMCPRALLGHPLKPHKIMRRVAAGGTMEEMLNDPEIRNAALCCECGICEIYACPMGLQPRKVNSVLKKELAKSAIRYQRPEGVWTALPEREMRKVPTDRVAARVGVTSYENIEINEMLEIEPEQVKSVCLKLRQGVGASSIPVVEDGEQVKEGQLIAMCPEGKIGAALHASVSGIIRIGEDCITIQSLYS